jgi:O-antigen ligase
MVSADESLEADAPPVGEEIHLPEPSLLPILNAVGISLAIVGITISLILVIGGACLFLVTALVWIRAARRETEQLPLEHGHH